MSGDNRPRRSTPEDRPLQAICYIRATGKPSQPKVGKLTQQTAVRETERRMQRVKRPRGHTASEIVGKNTHALPKCLDRSIRYEMEWATPNLPLYCGCWSAAYRWPS